MMALNDRRKFSAEWPIDHFGFDFLFPKIAEGAHYVFRRRSELYDVA